MNPAISNKKSCLVLVFNPLKRLIAIYKSVSAVAQCFHTSATNVHLACTGGSISCCGVYLRHLDDKIEITFEDFGTLRLEEYDQMCGVKRTYYKTKDMTRRGTKYKSKTKFTNED